ncbi:hypothetical protein CBD41_08115 [bacterium TMED181]|nr:MAG: hypothetical protein CBD41_08115 [bacterium TMED181]
MDKRKKIEDSLAKNLPQKSTPLAKAHIKDEKDIKDDYEFSRETYKDLINTGVRSLDVMSELARESEHPRAFEVLSNSIKNIGDVTDKLMALQKTKKELNKEKNEEQKKITNNNVFVGSTADLQRMLSDDKVIDIDAEN